MWYIYISTPIFEFSLSLLMQLMIQRANLCCLNSINAFDITKVECRSNVKYPISNENVKRKILNVIIFCRSVFPFSFRSCWLIWFRNMPKNISKNILPQNILLRNVCLLNLYFSVTPRGSIRITKGCMTSRRRRSRPPLTSRRSSAPTACRCSRGKL